MAGIRREPARRRAAEYAGLVLSVIVLAAGLVVIAARPSTATQFATLHPLGGTVQVAHGRDPFRTGPDEATLRADDVIRTGADGIAEIEYFDGSVTRLDHDTTLTLERVASIEEKDRPGAIIETELETGRTFNRVREDPDPDSRFEVEASGASAQGQGATYVLSVLPTGLLALWVLPDEEPGAGTVSLEPEEGERVRVPEGGGATVFQTGQLGAPFRLTDAHFMDPWVSYNLCRLEEQDVVPCPAPREVPTPKPQPQRPPPSEPAALTEPAEAPETEVVTTIAAPPEAVLLGGPRGPSDTRRARFRFQTGGPVAFFQCSLDGGSFRRCSSPQRYPRLSDGTHLFLVRAVDAAGTPGPVARRRWVIDTAPPETLITGPSLASGGSQALFSFVSSERRSRFLCRLDGGPFVRCRPPVNYAGLGIGTHTFQVRAVDRAGNADRTPAAYSWTVGGIAATASFAAVAAHGPGMGIQEEDGPPEGGPAEGSSLGEPDRTGLSSPGETVSEVRSLLPPLDTGGLTEASPDATGSLPGALGN